MFNIFNRPSSLFIPILFFSIILTSCLDDSTNSEPRPDLLETIQNSTGFTTITDALDTTGLDSTLTQTGPYTVLLPSDDAFSKLPSGMLDSLSNQQLTDILSYHIVDSFVNLNQLNTNSNVESLQGEDLYFELSDSAYVNQSRLLNSGNASNGVLYGINKVLLPDEYSTVAGLIGKRLQLGALDNALAAAGLTSALEDASQEFTVFAPSNDALASAELPEGQQDLSNLLQYHVIPQKLLAEDLSTSQTYETLSGEQLTVGVDGNVVVINGEAAVTTADIEGTNGVVHMIDGVLAPSTDS